MCAHHAVLRAVSARKGTKGRKLIGFIVRPSKKRGGLRQLVPKICGVRTLANSQSLACRKARSRSIARQLLTILEELPPEDPAGKYDLFCELLNLEDAAHAAHVEQWLLDEVQIARETAGEEVLTSARECSRH
ncbi:hypothetical protein [Methylobacterium durans]|uniref:hypothetical protein n=1 Tax=Methylobacterium durans TaxID=2202825 RepID=UPI0013A594A6|nr:hypothetical protein [Methylobacterium durans]